MGGKIPQRAELLEGVGVGSVTYGGGQPVPVRDDLLDCLQQSIPTREIKISVAADQILADLDIHVLRECALLQLGKCGRVVVDQRHQAAQHQVFKFAIQADN